MEFPRLKQRLLDAGACRVGFADFAALPDEDVRRVFRARLKAREDAALRGVGIAVMLPPEVVAGLGNGPTRVYYDAYCAANERLDALATQCARWLEDAGFAAWAQARDKVARYDEIGVHVTRLPHKTVATLAGLGWIGKDALLVSARFGSAVRITSVLTDAPLPCDVPMSVSHCGTCDACVRICPAGALHGPAWRPGVTATGDLVDVERCSRTATRLSRENFGVDCSICGLCLYVCPFTQKWLRGQERGRTPGAPARQDRP
jgi:epoxyqueuosine reductase QueG